MTIFIDVYSRRHEHEKFNTNFISDQICVENCELYIAPSAVEYLTENFSEALQGTTLCNLLEPPETRSQIKMLIHTLRCITYLRRQIGNTKDIEIAFLVTTNWILLFSCLFLSKCKKKYVFHSVASTIFEKPNPLRRLFWIRYYIPCVRDSEVIVLSTFLAKKFKTEFPNIKVKKYEMEIQQKVQTNPTFRDRFKVGYIGNLSREKGGAVYLDFIEKNEGRFDFLYFGADHDPLIQDIKEPDTSINGLEKFFSSIDFLLLPYDVNHYKYTRAEVMFDCISYRTPFFVSDITDIRELSVKFDFDSSSFVINTSEIFLDMFRSKSDIEIGNILKNQLKIFDQIHETIGRYKKNTL